MSQTFQTLRHLNCAGVGYWKRHSLNATNLVIIPALVRTCSSTPQTRASPYTGRMSADQATLIEHGGNSFHAVKEGKATILVPPGAKFGANSGEVQQVFYNPIQQYNRDLSTLAIKTYGEQVVEQRRAQLLSKIKRQQQNKKRKRPPNDDDGRTELEKEAEHIDSIKSPPKESQDGEGLQQQQYEDVDKKIPFKILDALSASGLRALRYAHELPFVTSIHANDLSQSAAESIKINVAYNGVADRVTVTNDNCLGQMYRAVADDMSERDKHGNPGKAHKWDVIDLDPYGTAAPFFDVAVQAVRDDGGLLCITCTDSAVWAGHAYLEKCFSLYGGTGVKGIYSHEAGLRLILNAVASSAARYGLAIEPQLSLSIDFYTKCFVKVTRSPQSVKFLGSKTIALYSCDYGCGAWETQYLMRTKQAANKKGSGTFFKFSMAQGPSADSHCPHCGTKTHLNGPMYGGPIHSPEFVHKLLDQIPNADPEVYGTLTRLEGMLRNVLEERLPEPEGQEHKTQSKDERAAEIDPYPFYYTASRLAATLSCKVPSDDMFRGAIVHLGYRVGRSHCKAGSIKTDAPWSTMWWIMTEWIRQKAPITQANINQRSAGYQILLRAGLISQDGSEQLQRQDKDGSELDRGGTANGEGESAEKPEAVSVSPEEAERRKTLIFDDDLARLGRSPNKRQWVRYQQNPAENWGPLSRASKH